MKRDHNNRTLSRCCDNFPIRSMIDILLTQYTKVLIAQIQLCFHITLLRKFLFCHSRYNR